MTQQITNINPVAQEYIKDIFSKVPLPSGTNTLASLFRNAYNFEQELARVGHTFNDMNTLCSYEVYPHTRYEAP